MTEQIDFTEIKKELAGFLPENTKVYIITKHISKSQMTGIFTVYCVQNNQLVDLTARTCKLLGRTFDRKHGGLRMGYCGTNFAAAIVAELAETLYNNVNSLRFHWLN